MRQQPLIKACYGSFSPSANSTNATPNLSVLL